MSKQATTAVRVLVAGLGNMGISHASAYQANPGFEIAGLVNRSSVTLPQVLAGRQVEPDFYSSLHEHKPELVSVNTCLLYTSPSPRDQRGSRMPSSA